MNDRFFREVWPRIASGVTRYSAGRFVSFLSTCAVTLVFGAQPSPALPNQTDSEIRRAANDLAAKIKEGAVVVSGKGVTASPPSVRVLVLPFPLSDRLSQELGKILRGREMVDPAPVLKLIHDLKLSSREYMQPAVATWLGRWGRATLVVVGSLSEEGDRVALNLSLLQTHHNLPPVGVRRLLPRTDELVAAIAAHSANRAWDVFDDETVPRAGRGGAGYPKCLQCPNPSFYPSADLLGGWSYKGVVLLKVVVSDAGIAREVEVLEGAAFDLNDRALSAVKQWKFDPARDVSGRHLTVWTTIEVSFSVY